MKLVALSDTHWTHQKDPVGNSLQSLSIPDGDILIHAGDATFLGKKKEWYAFMAWWSGVGARFKHRIFVPGNHDYNFKFKIHTWEAMGLKFGMMPEVPNLPQWNFSAEEWEIKMKLERIGKVDVLITHGPPQGILDNAGSYHFGSVALREFVEGPNKPRVHIFGHAHDAAGFLAQGGVEFYNVAICNEFYWLVRQPTEIEL